MKHFTENQITTTRSICDSACTFSARVIKRTAKSLLLLIDGEQKRVKIQHDQDGNEYCFPFGRFSMAPIFRP
jgi:biotin synthase-related radical SAM superfamily protein